MEPASTPSPVPPTRPSSYTFYAQTGPGDERTFLAQVIEAFQELRRGLDEHSEPPRPQAVNREERTPSPAGSPVRIRFSWRAAGGGGSRSEVWGELRIESLRPHPHRAGTILVSGRWPTGQKAEWEMPANETKWGRGTEIKIRWAAGPDGSPMQTGIFGIVEVTARPDGLRTVKGIWPDGIEGAIELPSGWSAATKGPE